MLVVVGAGHNDVVEGGEGLKCQRNSAWTITLSTYKSYLVDCSCFLQLVASSPRLLNTLTSGQINERQFAVRHDAYTSSIYSPFSSSSIQKWGNISFLRLWSYSLVNRIWENASLGDTKTVHAYRYSCPCPWWWLRRSDVTVRIVRSSGSRRPGCEKCEYKLPAINKWSTPSYPSTLRPPFFLRFPHWTLHQVRCRRKLAFR